MLCYALCACYWKLWLLPYDKVEEDYVSDPEAPLDAEEDEEEEEEEVKEMSFCKILSGPVHLLTLQSQSSFLLWVANNAAHTSA